MEYKHNLIYCLLTFFWALMVSLFAMPSIISMAHAKGLLDEPNQRTMHTCLTPRLGGLGIFAGFFSAITIFGDFSTEDKGIQMLLASIVVLFFVGLKDDITPVSVFKKFFMQVLATAIVVFFGDVRIDNFYGFLGVYGIDYGTSYALTFLVIIGLTNSINLIDGLDGLAGSLIVFISLCFGMCFFLNDSPYVFVSVGLAGALLGFLKYNVNKATIFMGDTGSLVSGFVLSVLAIKAVNLEYADVNMPAMTLAILIIPVVDTLRVFIIRTLDGKSPFIPDRRHLHHLLSEFGFGPNTVILILLIVNVMFVLSIYFLSSAYSIDVLVGCILLLVLFSLAVLNYLPRIIKYSRE